MARRLSKLGDGVKNFKPEFKKSADFLVGFFGGQVFETRGKIIGEPWKTRTKAYPWPILERSGKMRRSFKGKAKRLDAAIYNAMDYFKFHQSKAPRRKLPRRIMMKLDEARKTKIVHIFHEGLWKRVRKTT